MRSPFPLHTRLLSAAGHLFFWVTAVAALGVSSCGNSEGLSTSSSSHWIVCASDKDCDNLPQSATCSGSGETKGYCVDEDGTAIELVPVVSSDLQSTALDTDLFSFELGANLRNNELQTYTNNAANVFVDDGEIVIVARFDQATGEYTSGSLELLEPMKFGRLEASISGDVGSGASPSFWLLPADPGAPETTCVGGLDCAESTWPVWGGIVVMSGRADGSTIVGVSYVSDEAGTLNLTETMKSVPDALSSTEAHRFALNWGPQRMEWFVDGQLVHTVGLTEAAIYHPGGINPFLQAFRVKLNLAVGGLTDDPVAADYPREMRVTDLKLFRYSGQD